jgi:hypothetical protein
MSADERKFSRLAISYQQHLLYLTHHTQVIVAIVAICIGGGLVLFSWGLLTGSSISNFEIWVDPLHKWVNVKSFFYFGSGVSILTGLVASALGMRRYRIMAIKLREIELELNLEFPLRKMSRFGFSSLIASMIIMIILTVFAFSSAVSYFNSTDPSSIRLV